MVQHVWRIPCSSQDSTVCGFYDSIERMTEINPKQFRRNLWSIVTIMGKTELVFFPKYINLHNILSGGAMAMFLSGLSTIDIQKLGKWPSEVFLEYTREQI